MQGTSPPTCNGGRWSGTGTRRTSPGSTWHAVGIGGDSAVKSEADHLNCARERGHRTRIHRLRGASHQGNVGRHARAGRFDSRGTRLNSKSPHERAAGSTGRRITLVLWNPRERGMAVTWLTPSTTERFLSHRRIIIHAHRLLGDWRNTLTVPEALAFVSASGRRRRRMTCGVQATHLTTCQPLPLLQGSGVAAARPIRPKGLPPSLPVLSRCAPARPIQPRQEPSR